MSRSGVLLFLFVALASCGAAVTNVAWPVHGARRDGEKGGVMRYSSGGEVKWASWVKANTDPYGKCCVDYAAAWSELMEKKIDAGAKLEDIAEQTSYDVNEPFGITGFMYGCAVEMLAVAWEHGEALRRWHNLDIQIKNEGERANESGGVLNPALLSISTPEAP